jgi:hypothetical protein
MHEESLMTAAPQPRRSRWMFLAVSVITASAIAATIVGLTTGRHPTGPVDLRGHLVQAEEAPVPGESATADTGARFVVRSVGLDVPLGALDVAGGVVSPPGFTSAYWIRNEGVPVTDPAKGTVFVVMHSLRNGGVGPGNYLIDVPHRKAKVAKGAVIQVDGVAYRVTETGSVRKTQLGQQSTIWANTPERLVVITCLQRPGGGPSVDNLVIQAVRT